jgi:alcohol dehydrogenase class IV
MIASSMANIACGNARLGHAHTLSLPLEGLVDLPHPLGVGVLMPHALAFNLVVLPRKARKLADALGVRGVASLSDGEVIAGCVSALRSLYDDIGFSSVMDGEPVAAHKNQGDGGARRPRTVRGF